MANELVPEKRIADFEEMAFGMFIHWGIYSQMGKGEWAKHLLKIEDEEYDKLVDTFNPENFDADAIISLAKQAGMKYITITTRHHDGFSLYDSSPVSHYNSLNSPAKRDLIREFVDACNKEDIMPVFYHTTLDWHNKDFRDDFNKYLDYLHDSVEILCTRYGKIGGLWFDGNWSKPDGDWKLDRLYGMIRGHQPEALIINNTGLEHGGKIGHKEIDSVTFEQGLPSPIDRSNMTKYVTGEMCYTMNDHWGFGANDFNYKSPVHFIKTLCKCREVGANLLLNIGPEGDGSVPTIVSGILKTIGDWMNIFGDAIYRGRPCGIEGAGEDFALKTPDGKTYLFIFDLPIVGDENVTVLDSKVKPRTFTGLSGSVTKIKWIDNNLDLHFMQDAENGVLTFYPTGYQYGTNLIVRVAELI